MRVVMLLLVVAVIGLLMAQMLSHQPPVAAIQQGTASSPIPPAAPTHPRDVKTFEQNMNRFIQDASKQRANQEPVP
jgi:hypothetical protein